MQLYPLKFRPILKEKIWGGSKIKTALHKDYAPLPNCGESWEISGVEENISVVNNGFLAGNNLHEIIEIYMGDLVGEKVYEKFGMEFPLLIKFIDANADLSIQVHPDDKLSKKRHSAFGKTEMWYILEAEEDGKLIAGFNQEVNKEKYLKHLNDKTLKEILNIEKVKSGDVFFIPAGRVHAIGSGVLLAEIQQTSDITYRIYDWDRKDAQGNTRELHTDMALDAIDYSLLDNYKTDYISTPNQSSSLVDGEYFTTNIIEIDKSIDKEYQELDSFVIYMCLEGDYVLTYNEGESLDVKKGETILLPAIIENVTLTPRKKTKILEVYIK